MLKLITAASLVLFATNVYADSCFDSCDQECLRSGSLARTCQLECTQECPFTQPPPPPVCTLVDNPAHDSCIRDATVAYVECLAAFPVWPIGGPFCTVRYVNAENACPPAQITVCH